MTPLDALDKEVAPWYRHRWPWLLMLGPFAVVVAGFVTMWISFTGADALVVDDYYKQGKAINQDLRRDRVAATLGLGGQYAAMYTRDAKLAKQLYEVGQSSGDRVWHMPLVDDYQDSLESEIADLNHAIDRLDAHTGHGGQH